VELVESANHLVLFYPKFHCELNFIEMYWAQVKRKVRSLCDYSFESLKRTVPEVLDQVGTDVAFIRRIARHCYRYIDAYRIGLSVKLAAYAVKTYAGHRTIPNPAMVVQELRELGLDDDN
jgi:hypothetical protein